VRRGKAITTAQTECMFVALGRAFFQKKMFRGTLSLTE